MLLVEYPVTATPHTALENHFFFASAIDRRASRTPDGAISGAGIRIAAYRTGSRTGDSAAYASQSAQSISSAA
jgi:hypothetical protein